MKRFALYSVVISIFLFTGCNQTENLNCTRQESTSENMQLNESLDLVFHNYKLSNLSIYSEFEISGNYVNYVDDLVTPFQKQYKEYEGKKGVEVTTHQTDHVLSVKVNANINQMDDVAKDALGIENIYKSVKSTKKELEELGFICE